jgi:hypothetical protein
VSTGLMPDNAAEAAARERPLRVAAAERLGDITVEPAITGSGAAVESADGRVLTRGQAEIVETGGRWTARVTQLDRPGVIALMFFSERARDVVLRLDDGRHARARIAGTSFIAANERVCDLAGIEPLLSATA